MSERRTASILQRVPVILAVTAGSYGLSMRDEGTPRKRPVQRGNANQKPVAALQGRSKT